MAGRRAEPQPSAAWVAFLAATAFQLQLLWRSRAYWLLAGAWLVLVGWQLWPVAGLGPFYGDLRLQLPILLPVTAVFAHQVQSRLGDGGRSWQYVLPVPAASWLLARAAAFILAFALLPVGLAAAAAFWVGLTAESAPVVPFLALVVRDSLLVVALGVLIGLTLALWLRAGGVVSVLVVVVITMAITAGLPFYASRWVGHLLHPDLLLGPVAMRVPFSDGLAHFPEARLAVLHHAFWATVCLGGLLLVGSIYRPHRRSPTYRVLAGLGALAVLAAGPLAAAYEAAEAVRLAGHEERAALYAAKEPDRQAIPPEPDPYLPAGEWELVYELEVTWDRDAPRVTVTVALAATPQDSESAAHTELPLTLRHNLDLEHVELGAGVAGWERDGDWLVLRRSPDDPPGEAWTSDLTYSLDLARPGDPAGVDRLWPGSPRVLAAAGSDLLWLPADYGWYPLFGRHRLMEVSGLTGRGGRQQATVRARSVEHPRAEFGLTVTQVHASGRPLNLVLPPVLLGAPGPAGEGHGGEVAARGALDHGLSLGAHRQFATREPGVFTWQGTATALSGPGWATQAQAAEAVWPALETIIPHPGAYAPTVTVLPHQLFTPRPFDPTRRFGAVGEITLGENELAALSGAALAGMPGSRLEQPLPVRLAAAVSGTWWETRITGLSQSELIMGRTADDQLRSQLAAYHVMLASREFIDPDYYERVVTFWREDRPTGLHQDDPDRPATDLLRDDWLYPTQLIGALVALHEERGEDHALAVLRQLHTRAQEGPLVLAEVQALVQAAAASEEPPGGPG